MKFIPKDSKILNLTHFDGDGAGCSILLRHIYKNIAVIPTTYSDIDRVLSLIDFKKYDYVFLTDIVPNTTKQLDPHSNIVILDHHESAKYLQDHSKMWYVRESCCATMLTMKFLEKMYGIELKQFYTFVNLVNDYDMWHLKFPRSTFLNELFWLYFFDKFVQRFQDGKVHFTQGEINYLKDRRKRFREVFDTLDIYQIKSINGAFVICPEFVNDVSTYLLKKDYSIVFALNSHNKHLSIRHNIEGLNIGHVLEDKGIGGGHAEAGGLNKDSMEAAQKGVELVTKFIEGWTYVPKCTL